MGGVQRGVEFPIFVLEPKHHEIETTEEAFPSTIIKPRFHFLFLGFLGFPHHKIIVSNDLTPPFLRHLLQIQVWSKPFLK